MSNSPVVTEKKVQARDTPRKQLFIRRPLEEIYRRGFQLCVQEYCGWIENKNRASLNDFQSYVNQKIILNRKRLFSKPFTEEQGRELILEPSVISKEGIGKVGYLELVCPVSLDICQREITSFKDIKGIFDIHSFFLLIERIEKIPSHVSLKTPQLLLAHIETILPNTERKMYNTFVPGLLNKNIGEHAIRHRYCDSEELPVMAGTRIPVVFN